VTYTVQWARKTVKQLDKLNRTAQKKIVLAVTTLSRNPRPHGAKNLVTRPGEYRIRISDYRVVYIVLVVAVAHRREIYQIP
jgi:mRNA interferase RelE/StbE